MTDSNLIAVKLNVPEWNLREVRAFLQAREEGYKTIFNVLSEPERYQQDLEAVEQARDGGATWLLSIEQNLEQNLEHNFDNYYYAVFPTKQQADKFAKETGADKIHVVNYNHDLIPIGDVIEALASYEERPKDMDMSGKSVQFVGRPFLYASQEEFKKSAERVGANVARIITSNVDYVVFSENWRETHDEYLELTKAVGAIPLNEEQWEQIVSDCGG